MTFQEGVDRGVIKNPSVCVPERVYGHQVQVWQYLDSSALAGREEWLDGERPVLLRGLDPYRKYSSGKERNLDVFRRYIRMKKITVLDNDSAAKAIEHICDLYYKKRRGWFGLLPDCFGVPDMSSMERGLVIIAGKLYQVPSENLKLVKKLWAQKKKIDRLESQFDAVEWIA